jgi:hypothetical protein
MTILSPYIKRPSDVAGVLRSRHYLGAVRRGIAWQDEFGVMVIGAPTARRIPTTWLELSRWCLFGVKNGGSQQWARVVKWLRSDFPAATTVVSYSDPSVGHTGALYRACNWLWAPTWHRLRPPPTGCGTWGGGIASVPKDRWVFALRRDPSRADVLRMKDESILRRYPWAEYTEPRGADFSRFSEAA